MTDSAQPKRRRPAGVYRRMLRYTYPHWPKALIVALAMAISAATQPVFAWVLQPLVDGSFIERDPSVNKWLPPFVMAVFLVRGVLNFVSSYGLAWISRHVTAGMRSEIFETILRLPKRYYDTHSSGNLVSKLTYDVQQVAGATSTAVTILFKDGLTVVFLLAYMVWLSGWLALIFLGVGPILGILVLSVSKRFRRISRRIQKSVGAVATVTSEAVDGHAEVKIFGGKDYEAERFQKANWNIVRQGLKFVATKAATTPLIQFLAACALSVVIYLATLPTVVDKITAGTFVSFIVAVTLLLPAMKRLTDINPVIQKGIAAGISVFELVDQPIEEDTGTREVARATGGIRFHRVSFAYDQDKGDVLSEIDFAIEPGQTMALVGQSGSGKSTIANLIPRFYDPQVGQITLDGIDLRDYKLDNLRQQISLVGQHVVLFDDSVRNNIAYGGRDLSDDAIWNAAETANAAGFIRNLPDGIDTRIGENGVMLSGGQRQRLAIARALLKDAPILILDEATSALDTESERQIQEALERLMANRTTLVIAHRLSTIENADRIAVLQMGRLVETGTHADLLAKSGVYARLHSMQFSDAAANPETVS